MTEWGRFQLDRYYSSRTDMSIYRLPLAGNLTESGGRAELASEISPSPWRLWRTNLTGPGSYPARGYKWCLIFPSPEIIVAGRGFYRSAPCDPLFLLKTTMIVVLQVVLSGSTSTSTRSARGARPGNAVSDGRNQQTRGRHPYQFLKIKLHRQPEYCVRVLIRTLLLAASRVVGVGCATERQK